MTKWMTLTILNLATSVTEVSTFAFHTVQCNMIEISRKKLRGACKKAKYLDKDEADDRNSNEGSVERKDPRRFFTFSFALLLESDFFMEPNADFGD